MQSIYYFFYGNDYNFVVAIIDDSELWMVYHATDNVNDNGVNRRARIQKIEWNPDLAPRFPVAAGINTPLLVPSGE